MSCVSVLSTEKNTEAALAEVLDRAGKEIGGQGDLALIFASIHHAASLGKLSEELSRRGLARYVIGCTGESIVGEDHEVEDAPALALWILARPGLKAKPVRLTFKDGEFQGPQIESHSTLLLLGDPFSFPADEYLKQLNAHGQGIHICGGMASASHSPGRNRLVLQGDVYSDGAVGIELGAEVAVRTVVSQGCRPIGRPFIVTRVDGNLVLELGRRPALEVLQGLFSTLGPEEQALVQQGLHLGRVINEYQETFSRGDFLVRNVLGADEAGAIAIGDLVRVGQTVQFHVRDAETADEDLRSLLEEAKLAAAGSKVSGALLFSCNGRGTRLFPEPNHDVRLIHEVFGTIPAAGFFAMGEFGPVGGRNFVHGFTASIALFEEPAPSEA